MQSSLAIINGCLNAVNKQDLTLDDLSTADLVPIIRHLSREIDKNNNNSSTNSHNSTDDAVNSLNHRANSNEIVMRLLNQNEMLIKAVCNNYEQKEEESYSDRCRTFFLGSSIIRDLKQGNTTLNNKPHRMKFDKPDDAFNKIIALTDSLKLSYPDLKLVFTTIPYLNVRGIKPSIQQVNADVDEFNSRLLSLQDKFIDVIKVGYSYNMLLKDGIHLNVKRTMQLSSDIDEYLKNFQTCQKFDNFFASCYTNYNGPLPSPRIIYSGQTLNSIVITEELVSEAISKLRDTSSVGTDDIPIRFFKLYRMLRPPRLYYMSRADYLAVPLLTKSALM
ncbi:unnamed protein product [Didymodactylos carnosus]|uniref:Uncharacterized protein n=1 Tax=Didymodactylos carnosus TaxID=1234261 RepID=A0A815JMN1_9BILA|nr:unnamed protein product [Didymodactylos carnosus]CAF4277337.1 unnamed protein product [Didymodactylos carnosus]